MFVNCLKRLFRAAPKDAVTEEEPLMKYLIVGLGNIGLEYEHTRHNIGFDILDRLAIDHQCQFSIKKLAQVTEFRSKGKTIILAKPSTYMNLSGKAVRYWMNELKIKPENLLIVVDDLSLPLGKLRFRKKGSAGGHNGLKNIEQILGHQQYNRLKVGIGNDFPRGRQVEFVLGQWTSAERQEIPFICDAAAKKILEFCYVGIDRVT